MTALTVHRPQGEIVSVAAYEAMCSAIAESENFAECRDIADKMVALKELARRTKNTDAERRCANVRLIAERRQGEMLKELARATPAEANARGNAVQHGHMSKTGTREPASPYAEALAATGTSRQAAHRLQALADVPQRTFDDALRDPSTMPSRQAVLERAKAQQAVQEVRAPSPRMPDDSLWLWGRLRDLERDGYFNKNCGDVLSPMTETMVADMRRLVPLALDFFQRFNEVLHEHA